MGMKVRGQLTAVDEFVTPRWANLYSGDHQDRE
jgi:hypothetical protein